MKKYIILTITVLVVYSNGFSQLTNNGIIAIQNSTTTSFADTYTNLNEGILINDGKLLFNSLLVNEGDLDAKSSSLTVVNSKFVNFGNLFMEIYGGSTSDYSQIIVNGNLTLSGTLEVFIDPAYLPTDGTSHAIISYAGAFAGTFDTVNIISTSGWYIDYSTTGEVNIVRDSVLNIEDINESDFTVYPNPASDYISINSRIEIDKIELFDLLGKQVISTNQTSEINVGHLPVGVYLLKVFSEKGSITKKIIIN